MRTWCLLSASFRVNVFPHPPLQKNGFSPVWVSRWRLRSCCRLNESAHMSHAKGRGGDAGYWDALTCCAYAACEAYCAVVMLAIAEGACGDDDRGLPYVCAMGWGWE